MKFYDVAHKSLSLSSANLKNSAGTEQWARMECYPAPEHMSDCANCTYQFLCSIFCFSLLCPVLLDAACMHVWFLSIKPPRIVYLEHCWAGQRSSLLLLLLFFITVFMCFRSLGHLMCAVDGGKSHNNGSIYTWATVRCFIGLLRFIYLIITVDCAFNLPFTILFTCSFENFWLKKLNQSIGWTSTIVRFFGNTSYGHSKDLDQVINIPIRFAACLHSYRMAHDIVEALHILSRRNVLCCVKFCFGTKSLDVHCRSRRNGSNGSS